MENLALKVRLSVLWIFTEAAWLTYMILMTMEPGLLDEFINTGAIEGMPVTFELLLVFAILFLVPLVMAVLSLTLKGSANRWANIILGIVYTVLDLIDLSEAVAKQSAYATLMTLSVVVAPALIVWYAWKWPKLEA